MSYDDNDLDAFHVFIVDVITRFSAIPYANFDCKANYVPE